MNMVMDSRSLAASQPGAVSLREDQLRLGLWMFLATVTMLFAAFTSAYIIAFTTSTPLTPRDLEYRHEAEWVHQPSVHDG